MTQYQPWPDFTEPRPVETWPNPLHWLAAKTIHDGGTQDDAAKVCGRQRTTITKWVADWRKVYGPDFLPPKEGLTDDNRGSILGGEATRAKWQAIREDKAAGMASVAELALEVAEVGLTELLATGRAKALDSLDLERISRIAERLLRAADRAATPLGAGAPGGGDTGVPVGLLAGLETTPGQHADVLERLDVLRASYVRIVDAEAEEVPPAPVDQ